MDYYNQIEQLQDDNRDLRRRVHRLENLVDSLLDADNHLRRACNLAEDFADFTRKMAGSDEERDL